MKKKRFFLIISIISILVLIIYINPITDIFAHFLKNEPKIVVNNPNSYYRDYDFKFIQKTEDFIPYGKQDIKNIFYTVLNKGYDKFTFYCPKEYIKCSEDMNTIINDKTTLTNINNFTNPYNNFKGFRVTSNTSGEINIETTKLYTTDQINEIENKLIEIETLLYKNEMSLEDKILAIHNHIINITKYDLDKKDNNSKYFSTSAYGPLIEGYAVCGGYADAMALFLNRLGIKNYKVSSDTHIWNAIYLNDEWLHLDLTWDDPVSSDRSIDTLIHKFYLIKTEKLESYNIEDHDFDKTIYQELAS